MKKLLIPMLCLATPALASPTSLIEARSFAMGNTGVASASPGAAAIFNPAMLSMSGNKRNTQLIVPGMGIKIAADTDAQDGFENIDDNSYFDKIGDAVDLINNELQQAVPNQANYDSHAAAFANNTRALTKELKAVSGEPLNVGGGALFAVASTNKTVGFAVYANADMLVEITPKISQCDQALLLKYAEVIPGLTTADYSTANQFNCGGNTFDLIDTVAGELNDPADQLTSEMFAGAVIQSEVGVALSHALEVKGTEIAIGVTPKILSFTSQVAAPSITDFDDDNYDLGDQLEASESDDDMFNLDIGVATRLLNNSLTVGVVAKNLISDSFRTVADEKGRRHEYDIKPQLMTGVAYQTGAFTVAADLDLTANQAFFNDDMETQYLSGGVEYIVWSFLDLRAGLRSDLANSGELLYTTGLGLNIFAFNMDLSVQTNQDSAGLVFQLAANF